MATRTQQVTPKMYAVHTSAVAEVTAKLPTILNGLGDFTIPGKGTKAPPRPSEGDVIDAMMKSTALSAATRKTLRDGKAVLKQIKAGEAAIPAADRAQMEASVAILWASRTEKELEHGLRLIATLFPGTPAANAVPHVRAMFKAGAGVIYSTEAQVASSRRALPKAIYRDKGGVAAVDFGTLVGGLYSGVPDPRKIAVAAAAASAAVLATGLWDWIFGDDDEVPLFPGGTGPYNPCPTPNP